MKKLKKNQLKLDKEVISSLSENELSVVKGGVNTEPLTRCLDGKTLCMVPAPSVVVCLSANQSACCINSELCITPESQAPCVNPKTQQCIVNPTAVSCNGCAASVDICRLTDKC